MLQFDAAPAATFNPFSVNGNQGPSRNREMLGDMRHRGGARHRPGYEATMYLLERGVRQTGIDGWSWGAPFAYTAKKYAETKDVSLI